MDGASMDGSAVAPANNTSYLYVVVMYGIFFLCFVFGSLFRDARERQKKQIFLTADDRLLRGSLRAMLLLGGFIIVLSFPLTGADFYTSESFTLSRFALLDLQSLKNVLHGGFVVGVYSNFCSTGNPRYFTLTFTFLIFLLFPCGLASILTAIQLFQFGPTALPNFAISITMLLLTLLAWLFLRRAYDATVHAKFRSRTLSLLEGEKKVLQLVAAADRIDQFLALRKSARRWMLLEGGCFVLINALLLIYRIRPALNSVVTFDQFLPNFIAAYTMSIHLGWTVGNGLHGVGTNAVKSIELYGYCKIVIGSLNLLQTLALCYRAAYPQTIVPADATAAVAAANSYTTSQVMPSVLFSVLYTFAQSMALYYCYHLRAALNAIRYDGDVYNPDGEVVANESGFSILELARSTRSEVSLFAKGRAFRAAIVTMACGLLLQAEGLLLIATDVSPEAVMTACDGGLHSVAVFMLQYYRSVQNFTVRLLRRRTLQMWSFLCYAFVGSIQMIGLFSAAGELGKWTDTLNFAFIVLLLRISFNAVGAWSFYSLRLLAPETACCLIVTRENIPADSLRARHEQEMTSLALPTATPGYDAAAPLAAAVLPPVAMIASPHQVFAQLRGSEPLPLAIALPASAASAADSSSAVAATSGSNDPSAVSIAAPASTAPIPSASVAAVVVAADSVPTLASSIAVALPADAAVEIAQPAVAVAVAVPAGPKRYTFDRLPENLKDSDFADDVSVQQSAAAASTTASTAVTAAAAAAETKEELINPQTATPFDADPIRNEDEFFAAGETATISWAVGMATLGALIAFLHTAISDPSGLLYAASHNSASAIGPAGTGTNQQVLSAAHISTWHTPSYSIVFHFCFLVFGYGYRGVRARNVTLLQFTFLTTLAVGAVLLTGAVASILTVYTTSGVLVAAMFGSLQSWMAIPGSPAAAASGVFPFWLYVGLCAFCGLLAWWTAYRQRVTSLYVQKFPLRYRQGSHSMM